MPNCCTDTNDCGGYLYSSNCVVYGGDDNTTFDISRGDNLTSILYTIFDNLVNLNNGRDVLLPDLSTYTCTIVNDALGSSTKNLTNVLQAIIDTECNLQTQINTKLEQPSYTFDSKCYTFSDNKLQTVIQGIINQSCTNKTDIATANTKIAKNTTDISTLQSQMASVLGTDSDNTPPAFTFSQLMPPYVPMPYIGDLSNFDSTGAGKSANGYGNIYIMNGQNGTQDWRGYTPMGANSGVPGGSMDSRVNPSANSGFTIVPGGKTGEIYHKMTTNEMPNHTHTVIDPGHSHNAYQSLPNNSKAKKTGSEYRIQTNSPTSISKTGISLAASGGGQAHNNIQPSVGVVWIVKLP